MHGTSSLSYKIKISISVQESRNFYLLDVYADCDSDREEEIEVRLFFYFFLHSRWFKISQQDAANCTIYSDVFYEQTAIVHFEEQND